MVYVKNPETVVTLDGKVSGTITIIWQGNGHAFMDTRSDYGKPEQRLAFRGTEYRVSIHVIRDESGEYVVNDPSSSYNPSIRRGFQDDAPRTYAEAITAACLAKLNETASESPDLIRQGEYASAMTDLDRAQGDVDKLRAELSEATAKLGKARMRVSRYEPKA